MSRQGDGLHEAIRVAGASVGNPDDSTQATALAIAAVEALGYDAGDFRGWVQLAAGLMNLNMLLLAELEIGFAQAPLDVLRAVAIAHPRADVL